MISRERWEGRIVCGEVGERIEEGKIRRKERGESGERKRKGKISRKVRASRKENEGEGRLMYLAKPDMIMLCWVR